MVNVFQSSVFFSRPQAAKSYNNLVIFHTENILKRMDISEVKDYPPHTASSNSLPPPSTKVTVSPEFFHFRVSLKGQNSLPLLRLNSFADTRARHKKGKNSGNIRPVWVSDPNPTCHRVTCHFGYFTFMTRTHLPSKSYRKKIIRNRLPRKW